MPEYEHFSYFQNIFFVRAEDNIEAATDILTEICSKFGQPELTKPLKRPAFECEIMLVPERHSNFVPSLQKPLRLGLTFTWVGGPKATARNDSTIASLSQHGYSVAV